MAIYLDSASPEDAQRAMELGFVVGITTNPALLARAGRPPEELIPELCSICPGLVFYQLTAPTVEEREAEARCMAALQPDQVGIKIPCTTENLGLIPCLVEENIPCAVTAVFSAHQAYLACEAGAHYLIPYVNRATRLQGDGPGLVAQIVTVAEQVGSWTEVIAASLKTPAEVVAAVLAGAHHVSLPLDLILALGEHPLSQQAVREFAAAIGHSRSGPNARFRKS